MLLVLFNVLKVTRVKNGWASDLTKDLYRFGVTWIASLAFFIFATEAYAQGATYTDLGTVSLKCGAAKKRAHTYDWSLPVVIHRNDTLSILYRYREEDPYLFNLTGRFVDGRLIVKGSEIRRKNGQRGDEWFFSGEAQSLESALRTGIKGFKSKNNPDYRRNCTLKLLDRGKISVNCSAEPTTI